MKGEIKVGERSKGVGRRERKRKEDMLWREKLRLGREVKGWGEGRGGGRKIMEGEIKAGERSKGLGRRKRRECRKNVQE